MTFFESYYFHAFFLEKMPKFTRSGHTLLKSHRKTKKSPKKIEPYVNAFHNSLNIFNCSENVVTKEIWPLSTSIISFSKCKHDSRIAANVCAVLFYLSFSFHFFRTDFNCYSFSGMCAICCGCKRKSSHFWWMCSDSVQRREKCCTHAHTQSKITYNK